MNAESDVLRVALGTAHHPPYVYRCFTGNVSSADADCLYPGIVVDLSLALLNRANIPFSHVLHVNQSVIGGTALHYHMTTFLRPVLEWYDYDMQPLPALLSDRIAIVTTDHPLSVYSDPFGILKPFSWSAWCAILLIIVFAQGYSRVFSPDLIMLLHIRRFRMRFRPTFFPITFGLVLFTGLYRSGLLAKLLVRNTRYLVEDIDDLVNLPSRVQVVGSEAIWYTLIDSAPRRLQEQLAQRPFSPHPVMDADLGSQVHSGNAIFVGPRMKVQFYAANSCGMGFRVVELGPHYSLSFAITPGLNETIVERLNYATERSVDFAQNLVKAYIRRGPDLEDCLLKQVASAHQDNEKRQLPSFDLSSIRVHFLILFAGCLGGVLVFMFEFVKLRTENVV